MVCEKALLRLKEETKRRDKELADEEERQSCINIRICPDCGEDLIKEETGIFICLWKLKCPNHGIISRGFYSG